MRPLVEFPGETNVKKQKDGIRNFIILSITMAKKVNWSEAVKPLFRKYKSRKHPLEYKNMYQLIVMVILSARDSDKNVNNVAPKFFEVFPDMQALSKADPETLFPYLRVRNFANKANWLVGMARKVKKNSAIPKTMDELTQLPGIGRKSASVILREAGQPAEGVVVDLHVVRVAPRLGIATSSDPKKIEAQMMEALPPKQWDAGMIFSFHGREICRPKPLCEECVVKEVCKYYKKVVRRR